MILQNDSGVCGGQGGDSEGARSDYMCARMF